MVFTIKIDEKNYKIQYKKMSILSYVTTGLLL